MRRDDKMLAFVLGVLALLFEGTGVVITLATGSWAGIIQTTMILVGALVLCLLMVGLWTLAERIFKEDHRG
jgi:hypothetical protein